MEFKDFNEAVASGRPFYQLAFYDRRFGYSDVLLYRYFSTKKELETELRRMDKENKKLFEKMLGLYGKYGVTENNYRDFNIWNMLVDIVDWGSLSDPEKHLFRFDKDRVGYCHVRYYRRDLKAERKQEKMEMYEEEETGPYGGAFRDWDDYYYWREGKRY